MKLKHTNIFSNIPTSLPNELFETLLVKETLKIERIVSQGHSTPPSDWYDQTWDEWILLLQGHAEIGFGDDNQVNLQTGDYLFIPAYKRHRVEWTTPDENTVWLAIHIKPG